MEANLKQKIKRGETVVGFGVRSSIERDEFKRIVESGIYDFAFTDSQHSPFNEERLVEFCGNATELGMPVQFRIKHTRQAYLVGNLLDLGGIPDYQNFDKWLDQVYLLTFLSVANRWEAGRSAKDANARGPLTNS